MRGLVIDYARRRQAIKRGSEYVITRTGVEDVAAPTGGEELERLGEALESLALADRQLAELVDLHFFGGFTLAEIAELRGASRRTIQREWRRARLLLYHVLRGSTPEAGGEPA
jgi:DNA-directed RNA polymerase specialized sigma24 family protein